MAWSGSIVGTLLVGLLLVAPAFPQEGRDVEEGPGPEEREKETGKEVDKVLRALDEKQKGLKDLEADFVQTQVIHLLEEPDVSKGRLYWRQGRLRMEWSEPSKSVLVLGPDGLLLHIPSEGRAERYPAGEGDGFGALFPGFGQSSEEMRKTYEIRLEEGDEEEETWKLVLSPRRKKMRRWVGSISLWIGRDSGIPVRLRLDDPNGKDYTETTFSGTKVNQGIPDSRFDLTLPKGTEVTVAPGGLPF